MKLIEKLQQGGGIPAFVSFTNVPQPQPAAPYTTQQNTKSTETNDGGIGLLDKNMVKFLYENGIPSDVEAFIDKSGIFSNETFSNPFRKDSSLIQYKTILRMLPRIKAESERFKNAMSAAEKNDGLNEVAVTDGGYVITMDSQGNMSKKAMGDVDLESEQILTNSELANYRANNIGAAFNTDITSIISNGVGVSKITDFIRNITDKLGTSSSTREGYVSQQAGRVLKGLEYLKSLDPNANDLAGMSLDGVYKTSGMDKNQITQANAAINYIMNTMPKNMRTVLQAKAAYMLGDNSAQGVKKLVSMLTSSALKGEHSFTLDYKESLNPDGTKKSEKSSKDDKVIGPAEGFILGYGDKQVYRINNGTSYDLNVYGNRGIITTESGRPLGNATLADVSNKSTFAGSLDLENATMGNQPIDFSTADRIAIYGSKIVGADLPLDLEAKAKGIIKPDLDSLRRMEAADEEIRAKGLTTSEDKNRVYAAHQLPFKFDQNGNVNLEYYARFGILDAYADESAFKEDVTFDDSLSTVEDENERRGIERILKAADKDYKMSEGLFGGTTVYKGSVYVPINSNILNSSWGAGHNPTVQGNDAKLLEAKEQLLQKERNYQRPAPLSSYIN